MVGVFEMNRMIAAIGTSMVAVAAFGAGAQPALAQASYTISGSALGALPVYASVPGTSVTAEGSGATETLVLSSDNSVPYSIGSTPNLVAAFGDTAAVAIHGTHPAAQPGPASDPTLDAHLAEGAMGIWAFDQTAATGGSNGGAYWQVVLKDPQAGHGGDTIVIDTDPTGQTGEVYLDYGADDSAGPALVTIGGVTQVSGVIGNATWSQTATQVVDGLALGSWDVSSMRIATGAYGDDVTSTATISSITVPEPAAWLMMIVGTGAVGGVLRRRRQLKVG
jgi:hypothetical protein